MSTVERPAPRSSDLTSRLAALRVFAGAGSARVLAVAATVLIVARLWVGGWGRGDVIALTATIAITGTVEWIIHRHLLHAPDDSWTTRTLGTGRGHRRHHLDPTDLEWLLLRAADAGVFVAAFALVTAAWALPLMWITGSAQLGPFLTAWGLAALGLLHYEWVHLLVHTRYRCRSRYYGRLARHHRLHHFRNEHYWLGITSSSGDRLFGTSPADRSEVPLSATARTLDRDAVGTGVGTDPDPV